MSDPIEPALTPEQWRERMLPGAVCAEVRYDSRARQWTHELSIFHSDAKKDSLHAVLTPEHAHGVAALMLHQQPFGFTQHDVWVARKLAEHIDVQHPGGTQFYHDALALAERIAALLPPETG